MVMLTYKYIIAKFLCICMLVLVLKVTSEIDLEHIRTYVQM